MKKWKNRQKIKRENLFEMEPETVLVSTNTDPFQDFAGIDQFV